MLQIQTNSILIQDAFSKIRNTRTMFTNIMKISKENILNIIRARDRARNVFARIAISGGGATLTFGTHTQCIRYLLLFLACT